MTNRKYLMDIANLEAGNVPAKNCNAILFKNNCNNTPPVNIVNVNGYNLREGEQLILSGLEGEIDTTVYVVSISGAGASQDFQVIRKYYI